MTAHVRPLHLSQLDLVNLLGKTMHVVKSANATYPAQSSSEERTRLSFGDPADFIDLDGELSLKALRGAPAAAHRIYFEYRNARAPISAVTLRFEDQERSIRIEGTSLGQARALRALLERELSEHSTIVGGSTFRLLTASALWGLGVLALVLSSRVRQTIAVPAGVTMIIVGMLALLLEWFPGTGVYATDASLLEREESLISLVAACLAPLVFVLRLVASVAFRRKITREQHTSRERL